MLYWIVYYRIVSIFNVCKQNLHLYLTETYKLELFD